MIPQPLQNSFQALEKASASVAIPVLEQALTCPVPVVRFGAMRALVNRGTQADMESIVRCLKTFSSEELAFLRDYQGLLGAALQVTMQSEDAPAKATALQFIYRLKIGFLVNHLVDAAANEQDENHLLAVNLLDRLCSDCGRAARMSLKTSPTTSLPTQQRKNSSNATLIDNGSLQKDSSSESSVNSSDQDLRTQLLLQLRRAIGDSPTHKLHHLLDGYLLASHWEDSHFQAIFSPFPDPNAVLFQKRLRIYRSPAIDELLVGAYWGSQPPAQGLELLTERPPTSTLQALLRFEQIFGTTKNLSQNLHTTPIQALSDSSLSNILNLNNRESLPKNNFSSATSSLPATDTQQDSRSSSFQSTRLKPQSTQPRDRDHSDSGSDQIIRNVASWLHLLMSSDASSERILSAVIEVVQYYLPTTQNYFPATTEPISQDLDTPLSLGTVRQVENREALPIAKLEQLCVSALKSLPPFKTSVLSLALSNALHAADLTKYTPPRWKSNLRFTVENALALISGPMSLPPELSEALRNLFSQFTVADLLGTVDSWPIEHTAAHARITSTVEQQFRQNLLKELASPHSVKRQSVLRLFQILPECEWAFEAAFECLNDVTDAVKIEAMQVLARSNDAITMIQCIEPLTRDNSTEVADQARTLLSKLRKEHDIRAIV